MLRGKRTEPGSTDSVTLPEEVSENQGDWVEGWKR